MRIPLAQYPGMNRFVLDWMNGDERFLKRWSGGLQPAEQAAGLKAVKRDGGLKAVTQAAGLKAVTQAGGLKPAAPLAAALEASNKQWGLFVGDQVEQWARGETLTIIAGQQVGFAGGPLYTLAKLASLVRFKRDMEKNGFPVTAFFWLATEDHDFDEVATLNVPAGDRQLDLLCIRAVRSADARHTVGSLPVPEEMITQLLAHYDMPRPPWLRPGINFRDSFAELIASLFGNEIILVDALLPELRRAGAPLFDDIERRRDEIQNALRKRARELESAGYAEQVEARDGDEYTLLYELDEHDRRQTPTANRTPERTSTSALTRPLLQDFVFRPDVFVGGPAEVAYYAQIGALHELLGIPMPRVALRGHVLVAPKRVVRALERFAIEPNEIFTSADAILAEREPEGVAHIRELAEEGKRELMSRIGQIGELALPADHSLAGSIQRSVGHLEYHWNKLADRAIKGLVRKDRERLASVRDVVSTFYPDRQVQERVVSWFAYWCEHRDTLVARVIEEVEMDSAYFRIVSL
ncbi:MAG TPA: bacillithiol biosynthesis BshC [Thermoanaerobaculia bacterium]|nr:bacillithiol biosynthesis BshC [Thermoanaerobaculia bacterium]